MDFKKLGKFIIIAGVVLFIMGGLLYGVKPDPNNLDTWLAKPLGQKAMAWGIVIALAGLAVRASAKK